MSQCLKLLVAHVPKYHRGIQTICNIPLKLNKRKQGSEISGVVEIKCIEFLTEWSLSCVNLLHRFGARSNKNISKILHLHINIQTSVFVNLKRR